MHWLRRQPLPVSITSLVKRHRLATGSPTPRQHRSKRKSLYRVGSYHLQTLIAEPQQTITWSTADVIQENKTVLLAAPDANWRWLCAVTNNQDVMSAHLTTANPQPLLGRSFDLPFRAAVPLACR